MHRLELFRSVHLRDCLVHPTRQKEQVMILGATEVAAIKEWQAALTADDLVGHYVSCTYTTPRSIRAVHADLIKVDETNLYLGEKGRVLYTIPRAAVTNIKPILFRTNGRAKR